jgi:hypothetical protein
MGFRRATPIHAGVRALCLLAVGAWVTARLDGARSEGVPGRWSLLHPFTPVGELRRLVVERATVREAMRDPDQQPLGVVLPGAELLSWR